jgi:hypothetical protein
MAAKGCAGVQRQAGLSKAALFSSPENRTVIPKKAFIADLGRRRTHARRGQRVTAVPAGFASSPVCVAFLPRPQEGPTMRSRTWKTRGRSATSGTSCRTLTPWVGLQICRRTSTAAMSLAPASPRTAAEVTGGMPRRGGTLDGMGIAEINPVLVPNVRQRIGQASFLARFAP